MLLLFVAGGFLFKEKEEEKGGSCYRQLRRRQTRSLEAGRLSFAVDKPQAITELLWFLVCFFWVCFLVFPGCFEGGGQSRRKTRSLQRRIEQSKIYNYNSGLSRCPFIQRRTGSPQCPRSKLSKNAKNKLARKIPPCIESSSRKMEGVVPKYVVCAERVPRGG
jgi:hypothetical protein